MLSDWKIRAAPAWLLLAIAGLVPALGTHVALASDSPSYLAHPSLTSGRLPVAPVLFAALGHDLRAIAVAQVLIGGACWGLLIAEAAQVRHPVAGALSAVAIGVVASSTYVVTWYATVLSDSLSLSLLALIIALVARTVRTNASVWPLVAACCVWALTRSTNAYVLLLAVAVAAPWLLLRHRAMWPKLAALLLTCLVATALSAQGRLWEQPFQHSLVERILPDRQFRQLFFLRGMPASPALQALAGPFALPKQAALDSSPAFAALRSWEARSAQGAYTEFLALHLPWEVERAFGRHEELHPPELALYARVSRPWYPAPLRNVFLSERQTGMLSLIALDAL